MRDYRIGRLKGRHVVIWTDDEGKRRRYRLEANTAREAEREARDLILRLDAPPAGMTVAQVWGAYRAEMGDRRQGEKMDFAAKVILPAFGHLSVDQITVADCRGYIAKRRTAGRKDGTIRSELGCLRSAGLWARKVRLIDAVPPIEMPPTPAPRERYLSRDEVDRLLAAALDPHIKLAMLLMLTTAGRSGAILELTWDRVDFTSRTIRLAANDLGPRKGRATVPINDTLMAALQDAQRAAVSDFVVEWGGRPVRSIKTGFNAAVARAGIDHCTPHDLRRTAGRFMAEAGVPIEEIAEYLGHTNPNITRSTYARFSPEHLRRAAGSLEFGAPKLVQRTRVQTPKGRVSL
ncbi:site-specific integrase [Rhodovulum sulfidophilum]|uniref:Site-specific integrase n=1 Tax=Rhodovulum sulfidophilum TaxID=35806 RepID=A0ABS1RQS9_RHOSU|nr:site-specific integrase [Rhodovulum sulfidophilum]MBL3608247.1 site-specific integrase [Rhodovulum sulfidophilum]MCE8458560.1 site-specific integrase [Rhodovulum sulfidophilum]